MARKRFREIIGFQKKRYGGSTIFTTHTMNEAEKACDRILILVNGNTCVIDKVDNLKRMTGGFHLSIIKNNPYTYGTQLVSQIAEIFGVGVERVIIVEENQTKVTYDMFEVENLAKKFEDL